MKKIIFIFILLTISCFQYTLAEKYCPEDGWACYDVTPLKDSNSSSSSSSSSSWGKSKDIQVRVTERIPGVSCTPAAWACPEDGCVCTITPWFSNIQSMIWQIIKWLTAIAALGWVLFIVINWIMLSMHWWESSKIKERIIKTITWLVLLLLSWLILSIIAPWIYK